MLEAGWLLLMLFFGLGSLVVVACLWPAVRTTQHIQEANEAQAGKEQAPAAPKHTTPVQPTQAVKRALKKALRSTGWWITQLGQEQTGDGTSSLILTFSVEELGQIAASIARNTERAKAIRSMPRYSRKHHHAFATFFDQLKKAMHESLSEA